MRAVRTLAVLLLAATASAQQSFDARAMAGYEWRDNGTVSSDGVREQLTLAFQRAYTLTSLVRLFVRAEDYRGNSEFGGSMRDTGSRQIQPIAQLLWNAGDLHLQARTEVQQIRSVTGALDSTRRLQTHAAGLSWDPVGLPSLAVTATRYRTEDDQSQLALTDDNAVGALRYGWRGIEGAAEARVTRSNDPRAGYERQTVSQRANLSYAASSAGGRVSFAAEGTGEAMRLSERSLDGQSSSIPTPVSIVRTYWAVDDTPLDGRDHPLSPLGSLSDGDLLTSSGISLSADSISFQNLAFDLSRVDRVDEIRVLVRDASGNPLRNGGGLVSWDVYTSADGLFWSAVPSQTAFVAALSLYSVTFDATSSRWFKVVNFGLNADVTLVTELQAYVHTPIGAGQNREGTRSLYSGTTTLAFRATQKLRMNYSGAYSSTRQELGALPVATSSDLQNVAGFEYDLLRTVTLRGQAQKRIARTSDGSGEDGDLWGGFVDYAPTPQLKTSLEMTHQTQMLGGGEYSLDTKAVHVVAQVYGSLSVTLDAGLQNQTIDAASSTARRRFATLASSAQLFPSLRLRLSASLQETETDSDDPLVRLLGASKDNRVAADFMVRPGRQLSVSARYGYVSGQERSGFTQRYHVDWRPFGEGALSLSGALDQDIDPTTDRRATRTIFNPRWVVNRWAVIDLNYTSLSTSYSTFSQRQRSLFANVTFTR